MDDIYFQEFIEGPSFSSIFIGHPNRAELLGTSEQLVGEPWLHARPFAYCGSIAPARLDDRVIDSITRIGDILGAECGLHGIFGLDWILRDELPWVVEVNPRYTASVEVVEHSKRHRCTVGKAILFARDSVTFPQSGPWDDELSRALDPWRIPTVADIPHPGEGIERDQPILTLFATADNAEECRESLRERADDLDRRLFD